MGYSNSLTNPTNPISPLNPLNPLNPFHDTYFGDSNEIEKIKNKELAYIKEKLNTDNFNNLKLCGKEYLMLTHNLEKIDGLEDYQKKFIKKIIVEFIKNSYVKDKDKLKTLKILNKLIKKANKGDKKEILKEVLKNLNFSESKIDNTIDTLDNISALTKIEITEVIILVSLVIGSFVLSSELIPILIGVGLLSSITTLSMLLIEKDKFNQNIKTLDSKKNYLLDFFIKELYPMYPDINKIEFEKISKLVYENKFDVKSFSSILEEYYKDGKISEEEHKLIMEYLDKLGNTNK